MCRYLAILVLVSSSTLASAQPLRVASWNLGWHVATAEVPNWIDKCGRSYVLDADSKRWDLAATNSSATTGWFIKETRASLEGVDISVMPPCGVYQDGAYRGIAVTRAAFANRIRQISDIINNAIKPDVIAFQEVSGTAAVSEALGQSASRYHICSFDGQHKVQRLAFAWRKTLGNAAESCRVFVPLSLPELSADNQVRPALTLGLRLKGQLIRFTNVHLKSSCVSPLDRGRLDDTNLSACVTLQRQLRPLESVVESSAGGGASFVVLGDFNRNLWHELHEKTGAEAIRSDGERGLIKPMTQGVRSRNLFHEVFDGAPGGQVTLVGLRCSADPVIQRLCDASKTRLLTKDEGKALSAPLALGCRNSIGLDHFVVSNVIKTKLVSAEKIPLGKLGSSKGSIDGKTGPLLAVSDHCPIVMTIIL